MHAELLLCNIVVVFFKNNDFYHHTIFSNHKNI